MFQEGEKGFWYFKKTLRYYKRNVICRIMLLLVYPCLFNICFLQISPQVVGTEAPLENLLLHNVYVSTGAILCSLLWAYFPLSFKWELRHTITRYALVGCVFAFGAVWGIENKMSFIFIFICQILMMSLINFGLVIPGILKVFPVLARYRLMGLGWGLARFTNFFLIVFGLEAVKSSLGLYGCIYLLYGLVALALVAVWWHVSYYSIDGQSIWDTYKESRKNNKNKEKEELHIMTREEVDEYIYGSSKPSA